MWRQPLWLSLLALAARCLAVADGPPHAHANEGALKDPGPGGIAAGTQAHEFDPSSMLKPSSYRVRFEGNSSCRISAWERSNAAYFYVVLGGLQLVFNEPNHMFALADTSPYGCIMTSTTTKLPPTHTHPNPHTAPPVHQRVRHRHQRLRV